MTEINIKPMSVNEAWQGRRFKTDKYLKYERDLLFMLPKIHIPEAPYHVALHFGMSALSDIDNPVKPFLDIMQKKYKINDRDISVLSVNKWKVRKGHEFINFSILNAKTY